MIQCMIPAAISAHATMVQAGVRPVNSSNRFGLNYAGEAVRLGPPRGDAPIIDVHTHINGSRAARIMLRACDFYGIEKVFSMTALEQAGQIKEVFGQRIEFIAVPDWSAKDRRHAMGDGYIERLEGYGRIGTRIAKFWAAPRGTDYAREFGEPRFMRLDAPHRIAAMEKAASLGMIFMTHIGDPDTWFATKYRDAAIYGTKQAQYEPLEMLLDRFTQPWIAAHMGGWPENLEFIDGLLTRHANLFLDTSACKWQVRELSKHSRADFIAFLTKHRGRILFGSDIVTMDEHLAHSQLDPAAPAARNEIQQKASSEEEAFDLYASRYWAYRMMLETGYEGESPIADPDLAMVDPGRHQPTDAPPMRGFSLPDDLLRELYHDAASRLLPAA
jgi:hypothetical protein